jgi:hypothetical protein
VCLPVVNDLFLLVFGLVETIEDLLASPSSCSLEDLEEVLREELLSTIIKVRVSVLVLLYVCYSS